MPVPLPEEYARKAAAKKWYEEEERTSLWVPPQGHAMIDWRHFLQNIGGVVLSAGLIKAGWNSDAKYPPGNRPLKGFYYRVAGFGMKPHLDM